MQNKKTFFNKDKPGFSFIMISALSANFFKSIAIGFLETMIQVLGLSCPNEQFQSTEQQQLIPNSGRCSCYLLLKRASNSNCCRRE